MKRTIVTILLAFLLIAPSTFTTSSTTQPPSKFFTLTQGDNIYIVEPIQGNESAVDFYNYKSGSGHTPYMEDRKSVIYLYNDTRDSTLSLIIHHGEDKSRSRLHVIFTIEGEPANFGTIAFSDDNKPTEEFNLTRGNWEERFNSDGGIISEITTEGFNITITPELMDGIDAWIYIEETESLSLNKGEPITISLGESVSPDPDVGLTLFGEITASGTVAVTKFIPNPMEIMEIYYDIEVTASFGGVFEISLKYDDEGLTQEEELNLVLWRIPVGDVNLDGVVNNKDLVSIEHAIKASADPAINPWNPDIDGPWDPNVNNNGDGNYWNPLCDINKDGKVTNADYDLAALNLGLIWEDITNYDRPEGYIDTDNNIIYGETDHFSIFYVN